MLAGRAAELSALLFCTHCAWRALISVWRTGWTTESSRFCSGRCLWALMEPTVKQQTEVCERIGCCCQGRSPEGRLLSCILKELFSHNKAAGSVIKARRWQSFPFMWSPLGALPFLLKQSQPSPSFQIQVLPTMFGVLTGGLTGTWSCWTTHSCTPLNRCARMIVRSDRKLAWVKH